MIERSELIELVQSVQAGKDDAIAKMYDRFYEDIYYYILKTVNDADLAADLTQDTFLEIYRTIDTVREPAAFVTWSKKVAYHKCTAYFRKKKDVLVDETEDGYSVFETVLEEREEFIPDEALDQDEFKKTIKEMIDSLPEEQRAAIMMRYFDELSVKEIAEIQGVTEGTVKSRLNYARKSIKLSVETYEEKHGIKLHCKGVVPLLLWLFKDSQMAGEASLAVQAAVATAEETVKETSKALWERIVVGTSVAVVAATVVMPVKETKYQGKNVQEVVWENKLEEFKRLPESERMEFGEFAMNELCWDNTPYSSYYVIEKPDWENEDWWSFHLGIESYDLVKFGEVTASEADYQFYAAFVEAVDSESAEVLVNEIKSNIQPEKWAWYSYDENMNEEMVYWEDVTIEDFSFYTNGEYVFVSYVDQDLVNSGSSVSSEELNAEFDTLLKVKRELWDEN